MGERHTCAVRESGAVDCWGESFAGQTDAPSGAFRTVSAGNLHTCAVGETGDIVCWGTEDPLAQRIPEDLR